MKIITWNCNMAFRKKAHVIIEKQPDILIVPECEHPDKMIFKIDVQKPTDQFWYGKNLNKGIGVFSYSDLKIQLLGIHNPKFKYVLPLLIENDKTSLTVFVIWTQKPDKHDCYTEQVWKAVHYYQKLLDQDNVVLVGDFNSNSIWDKPKRIYNHSNLVNFLKKKRISSSYHYYQEEQGKESIPTLFMHRKIERPYHIDYCFVSSNLINKIVSVEIGNHETWAKHSDHTPLIVTLGL